MQVSSFADAPGHVALSWLVCAVAAEQEGRPLQSDQVPEVPEVPEVPKVHAVAQSVLATVFPFSALTR